jgi:type IV pilus assembly protein PilX
MTMTKNPGRRRALPALARRQRGVVLFVALIALVALTMTGISMVRAVDTGIVISGNMAFRQAAMHNSDIGIEAAFIALPDIIATSKDKNIEGQYFALRQDVDSAGVPSTIDWAKVPCRDHTNASVKCVDQAYQVKYVIDRLCEAETDKATSVTNIQASCFSEVSANQGGSKGAFQAVFSSAEAVYYRTTVQVSGPRNTTAYVQAIFSRS